MWEPYQTFQNRLLSFQPDSFRWHLNGFETPPSLLKKVDSQGNLLPFYGDTILFTLDDKCRQNLLQLQKALYEAAESVLSKPLSPQGFHLTLHDLSNGPSLSQLADTMARNAAGYRKICRDLDNDGFPKQIRLHSTCVFQMMNTSIVVGYEPASAQEYDALMALYHRFDAICHLPYPLTPHVTLAYYRPGSVDSQTADALSQTCRLLSREKNELVLDSSHLYYAEFADMDHYFLKLPAVF